jgi:HD-like signal output (HDOD) protein
MHQYIDFAEIKATDLLPSPKGVALNILRLCSKEDVALGDLAKAIQADPVLAGRVVKLANSAGLNRGRPVAAVTSDVLILVGVNSIRQLVLGMSLIKEYASGNCPAFDYADFWSRSIAMACAAHALAGKIRIAAPTEIFMCGLLAGIGRLGLASLRPGAYSDLLKRYQSANTETLLAAENIVFGMNHLELAAAMMEDWKIPRLFWQSVALYERHSTETILTARQLQMIGLLRVAAGIADLCVASDEIRGQVATALFVKATEMDVQRDELILILTAVSLEWLEWSSMLGVQARPLPAIEWLIVAVPETGPGTAR